MADDDEFGDDSEFPENEEWKTDDEEEHDQVTALNATLNRAKTLYVTQQLRHFEDDYVVVAPIGEPGQFGIAYECYLKSDSYKQRRCAKEINKAKFHHIGNDARDDILRTMQNEIAILRKVDHPNIVKLFDVYEDRHKLHLVMEFLPGGELFGRICEKESFSEKEAVRILKEILEALDHMHDRNILHLDLKPDNILFATKDEDSPIKLIDFGMARVVPRLAKLKDMVGTPNYMAPEVFKGEYSKAADLWSVGVITFCMLFGFPPFYADSSDIQFDEHKQLENKITKGFDPVVKEGFGAWFPADIPVSDDCRNLLSKMLEMDVTKRWTVKECLSSKWVRGFESASMKTVPPIVRDALKKFHHTSKFKVEISNLFTQKIDSDHRHEIKKFFQALDTNKDGSISMKEFKEGMINTFHTALSEEQLEAIFRNVDIDDNRTITFDELLTITAHRMLVDEDERLFQAFQELDEDGDGLISKDELENALNEWEVLLRGEIDEEEDELSPRKKRTHTRESTITLQRFQSAFGHADKNGDGQIDYEEFLRILHPDFGDNMSLNDLKNGVLEDDRVRGGQWNVDYETAKPSGWKVVQAHPKQGPRRPYHSKSMRTLALDAFSKRNKTKNAVQFEACAMHRESNNNQNQKQKKEIEELRE